MGTNSYVLTGTQKGFDECFGTTCHGAGRALSRSKSRRTLDYKVMHESCSMIHPLKILAECIIALFQ